MNKGLIQVYTGEGKGKTTAAFGLALRALGRGLRVIVLQFFKNRPTGEVIALEKHMPGIKVFRFHSQEKFIWEMDEAEKELLRNDTREGYKKVKEILRDNSCDLLVLDEIIYPVYYNFITKEELDVLLDGKPEKMEIVITGRNAPGELIAKADLVTEMHNVKHYFDAGQQPRVGIEQ